MPRKTFKTLTLIAAAASVVGSLAYVPVAEAFGFGDMMNPSKWMGGKNRDRDRYDDYYDDGPRGWDGPGYGGPGYGGPGYGYGGPGYGYGAPGGYGYGAPGYGAPAYGAPAYGAPGVAPAAPAAAPATTRSGSASEIDALKRRIDELESSQRAGKPAPAPAASDWPSAPAFRPMNKY